MSIPPRPADTKVHGRSSHLLLPAVLNLLTPTIAEVSAAATYDITNTYFADGTTWPEPETATIEAPRRGGETKVFSDIGDTTYGTGVLIYAVPPQAAVGSADKKLLELIPEGTERVLTNRVGPVVETDYATGQFLHLMRIAFGPSIPTTVGEGAAARAAARVTFAIRSEPAYYRPIVPT